MSQQFQPENPERFETALRRFDKENSRDPNQERVDDGMAPRELVYAQWLTDWVLRLAPEASEVLRLADRCQHLCRWMLPRESYPMTRAGYLRWREELKHIHAQKSGEILRSVGYPEDLVQHVQNLNMKTNFPHDQESRVLEDALCLVFLERQLPALASKSSEEKMVNALQKAWKKMTPVAHDLALRLSYGPREQGLINKALQGGS